MLCNIFLSFSFTWNVRDSKINNEQLLSMGHHRVLRMDHWTFTESGILLEITRNVQNLQAFI